MKRKTAGRIATAFGAVALVGLAGLIVAAIIAAAPAVADGFGRALHWLTVALPAWFSVQSLDKQIALVSAFLFVGGLLFGFAFVCLADEDGKPEPETPL